MRSLDTKHHGYGASIDLGVDDASVNDGATLIGTEGAAFTDDVG
jgi:hypothetical protein